MFVDLIFCFCYCLVSLLFKLVVLVILVICWVRRLLVTLVCDVLPWRCVCLFTLVLFVYLCVY